MSGHEPSPADTGEPRGFSLRRWSQRKHAAAREQDRATVTPAQQPDQAIPEATAAGATGLPAGVADGAVVTAGSADGPAAIDATAAPSAGLPVAEPSPPQPAALPPIESLTPGSDFAAFMRPGVDESLKRGALKQLFTDPHFNVMDGLDIYIDDYTRPDPIEPSVARQLLARITLDTSASAPASTGDAVAAPDVSAPPAPAAAEANDADVLRDPEALPGDTEAPPRERDTPSTSR